jgi:HAE1 family hydrophobic/amphiphilic exporter-1
MSSGLTREEIIAGTKQLGVLLSLIFVYFLLSAQYESYLVPLSILLSLPVGVAGAIVCLSRRIENNIYWSL